MQKHYLIICCLFCVFLTKTSLTSSAQNIGIGTKLPNSSSAVDITSTSKGLLIPRMTTTAITSITNPAKGLMVYDTSLNQLKVNIGTAAVPNWQTIVANSGWGLSGNSGTIPDNQFIGTTDNNPLRLRVDNSWAGEISPVTQNIFFGPYAGSSAKSALPQNHSNTGIGGYSLQNNTTGNFNAALEFTSLYQNTTGLYNSAVGGEALIENQGGSYNTAVGTDALSSNIEGNYNTAIGYLALTGTTNSAYNTVVGANSGNYGDAGYNNTILGANCTFAFTGAYNDIAIGQGVKCTDNSQARIGNSSTYSIGGFANWSNISDGRYKKNLKEDVKGLDFIMKLRPVTYNLDITVLSKCLN